MFYSPLELLVNQLTVERCTICNQPGQVLCQSCFITQCEEPESRCYICNKLTSHNKVCKSCKPRSRMRRVWWLGLYETMLKEIVWGMKYQRKRSSARLLGNYLSQTLPYLSPDTLITSVPTATKRVRQRGYDQAEMLARSFAYARGLEYKKTLVRINQQELIGKRRQERLAAMQGNLRLVHPEAVKKRSILLVDDVLTTGASLESAAAMLRKASATHVDAAVICRKTLG